MPGSSSDSESAWAANVMERDREERRRWEEYERQIELELEGLRVGVDEGAEVLLKWRYFAMRLLKWWP